MKDRFGHRHRIFTVEAHARDMATEIRRLLTTKDNEALQAFLQDHHPADLADAMGFLSDEEDAKLYAALSATEAAEVLDELDSASRSRLLLGTSDERLRDIIGFLPADEAADVLGSAGPLRAQTVLERDDVTARLAIKTLLDYKPDTAGGIMSSDFVSVLDTDTQPAAVAKFVAAVDAEDLFYIFVVDSGRKLLGTVDLRTLLGAGPSAVMTDLADLHVPSVRPDCDQEQVANVFARYDLTALPVTDAGGVLLGVVTADDIIDVIQSEAAEDMAHMVGSDATELEKKSPAKIAMMRMPWIMATMFIELIAGFVVKEFDGTLSKILLLASFMPIISAISGNTGLQSAAIIIRGLSTGHVKLADWRHAVARQLGTTLILGAACGITLGIIGALWYGKWTFGILVAVGMFASVNIAGAVGTAIPLVSKKLGFDPALTAGPFETAFQDVVGISIFLGMATLLMPWLK
jgi:magnesium transporter